MKKITISLFSLFLICCSSAIFASKETVTVTNNTGITIVAVFHAVGCAKIYDTNTNAIDAVCYTKTLNNGEAYSYEFGGGTSGRHVVMAIPENEVQESWLPGTPNQDYIIKWNDNYVNKSFVIWDGKSDQSFVVGAVVENEDGCDVQFDVVGNKKGTLVWSSVPYFTATYDGLMYHYKGTCKYTKTQS
jgi:hypothetical protein